MLILVAIINGFLHFILLNFYRYYFKVFKTKRLTTIKINICNFTKTDSLYEKVMHLSENNNIFKGMKPYVYSKKMFE